MRPAATAFLLSLISASPAFAQHTGPLPVVVVDARYLRGNLGTDGTTATDLGQAIANLPATGFGPIVGVHVYPVRRSKMSLGFGGEAVWARASFQAKDADGNDAGPSVERRFNGVTGAVSLNFGDADGWSYVSAGIGPMRLDAFLGDPPPDKAPTSLTQHFGAGARWFPSKHLAFCFDIRFYLTRPELTIGDHAGRDRGRLLVMSAGMSVK